MAHPLQHQTPAFGAWLQTTGTYRHRTKSNPSRPEATNAITSHSVWYRKSVRSDLGVSYFFITHDIATVRAISDEIVVMNQGKVVEQGPKSEILSPPHPAYTELLLSSVPEMDPDWLDRLLKNRKDDLAEKV